jgi:DNA-binding MarR family transcriptional regulator
MDHDWTFLTNHAHVVICIAQEPDLTMREIAGRVGITERAVQRIVAELADAGYLVREKAGRRNRYLVRTYLPLRHPVEQHCRLNGLLAFVLGPKTD